MARKETLKLPALVARPADVGRLLRELEALDEKMLQSKLRTGKAPESLPRTSSLMEQIAEINELDLLHVTDRHELHSFLKAVHDKAPVFHMSFNADPSTAVIEKVITWFRTEVHPQILLNVGLQPNLGAGSVLRTTNKVFDLSLRQDFARKRDVLMQKLTEGVAVPAPAVVPAPASAAPAAGAAAPAPPPAPVAVRPAVVAQPSTARLAPQPQVVAPPPRPAPRPHAAVVHERAHK